VLGILVVLALLSLAMDYAATAYGSKKMGATWRGMVGAILGLVVGLLFGPLGLVLGPLVGAIAFEMIGGRDWKEAAKAGLGTLIGLVLGAVGKLAFCVTMMGLFAWSAIARTLDQANG